MCNLALLLLDGGKGVAKDKDEAQRLLTRAAELGDPKAQYNIGLLYLEGQDLTKNVPEAYYWLTVAERHGIAEAAKPRELAAKALSSSEREGLDARAAAFRPAKGGK